MGIFDPDEDEFGARLRDLHRLDELVGPPGAVRADQLAALEQIGEQGRLEVIEILGRLDGGQDPEVIRARQDQLLQYARLEASILDLIANPQPRYRNGKVLYGPDGKPIPNKNSIRQARAALRRVQHARARLLGEAP